MFAETKVKGGFYGRAGKRKIDNGKRRLRRRRRIFPKGLDIEDDEEEANEETDSGSESEDDLNDPIDPDDYDVVVNAQDEIMIVMYEREGEPSSPQAFRTADGDILLKRNQDSLILFDSLPPETFEYFTKVSTILVNEIDDEGLSVHVYDTPLSDQ